MTPSQPEAGQTISFKVKAKNLDRSRIYKIKVSFSGTKVLNFNSCSSSTVSNSIVLASGTTGTAEKTASVSVNACAAGGSSISVRLVSTAGSGGTESINAYTSLGVSVSALQKPSKLRANGHSTNGKGATVRWNPVASNVSYELRYGKECVRTTSTSLCSVTSSTWINPTAVASGSSDSDRPVRGETVGGIDTNDPVSRTLSNLAINTIYRVQARTVLNGAVSDWSDPVFLYTSKDPPDDSVATYGFSSARTNGHYQYTICKRSFSRSAPSPSDREKVAGAWEADIESGIESWENGVKWKLSSNRNIIRASKTGSLTTDTGDCTDDAESSAVKGFENNMDFRRQCGWNMPDQNRDAVACGGSASGNISIDLSGGIHIWRPGVKTSSGCSDVHRTIAHEAGHVFGISDHTTMSGSIMLALPSATTCRPNAYDILAIMALYQSR